YLEYLPTSCIVPIESELSEQSSEISDLFTETSELNNEIIIQMYQIMRLFEQSSEQQSEINVINSDIEFQSSEISDLFSITSEQGIQISDLDVGLISLDQVVNQLSENLILFTNAGKIVDEVLRILHLFKAVLIILKILQHVVKTIAPLSELTIISDVGNTLDEILGMTSEAIFYYTSELDVEGIIQHLVNWLNSLLGVNLSVSASSSQSNQSSNSESSQNSNNSGGLLGGILGGL
ncbi:MAG: hypothetical protein OWS74_02855, partial [Firmicutes bacterium]|nr:hypothetical protein [Bacillota bacterium]